MKPRLMWKPNRDALTVLIGEQLAGLVFRHYRIGVVEGGRVGMIVADRRQKRAIGFGEIAPQDQGRGSDIEAGVIDQALRRLITKPDDAENWAGPYLKINNLPLDPWGHPYFYQSPSVRQGLDYDLCSLGSADKSGQPGDPGLICNNP